MISFEPVGLSRRALFQGVRRVMETLQYMRKVQRRRIVFKCVPYKGALPLYFVTGKYYTLDEVKAWLHSFSTALGFSICCFTAGMDVPDTRWLKGWVNVASRTPSGLLESNPQFSGCPSQHSQKSEDARLLTHFSWYRLGPISGSSERSDEVSVGIKTRCFLIVRLLVVKVGLCFFTPKKVPCDTGPY